MKKKLIGIFVCALLIITVLPVSGTASVFENVSVKDNKKTTNKNSLSSLEVSIDIEGSGRIFYIKTYITNTGSEPVIIELSGLPGGGFEIYNQNGDKVYHAPKYVLLIVWDLTLLPDQTETMYFDLWAGINDDGNRLPPGDYSVKGFVSTTDGFIYGEPENIHLSKAKNSYTFNFLASFPLLSRLLNLQ